MSELNETVMVRMDLDGGRLLEALRLKVADSLDKFENATNGGASDYYFYSQIITTEIIQLIEQGGYTNFTIISNEPENPELLEVTES